MANNPTEQSVKQMQKMLQKGLLHLGVVTDVDANDKHEVRVTPFRSRGIGGEVADEAASIAVDSIGDLTVPTEGDMAIYAKLTSGRATVLKFLYDPQRQDGQDYPYVSDGTVPDYEEGERRVGHPISSANIYFNVDGDVIIENDEGSMIKMQGEDIYVDPANDLYVGGDENDSYSPVARKGDNVTGSGAGEIGEGSGVVKSV